MVYLTDENTYMNKVFKAIPNIKLSHSVLLEDF